MKIEFDTRLDTYADLRRAREVIEALISQREAEPASPLPKLSAAEISRAVDPAAESFTPGDLSGAAPSGADAAQSPTAPEAPTAGVPVPPSDASAPATEPVVPPVPAPPSSPAASAELDIHGLPWDERIHAGSKARNADGSWRQRRNLSPVTLETVTAELRARAANAGSDMADELGADAAKLAALGVDPLTGQNLPIAAVVPPPPVTPELMAAAGAQLASPAAVTTQQFMEWLTPQMMAGKVTFAQVAEALKEQGMTSLGQLSTAPEHAGKADAVYRALGGE